VNLLRSRRALTAIGAVVLVFFLFRPAVNQLRKRIASSISSALGRRVEIENVRVGILPKPGFDLEGLVVYDDPAFSAEPMIRAQDVSAAIRIRSLLRGRLEIATLSASEPSINIVRNNQGRWNLASLIERNAQIPAAPTRKPASERRPAFPYLEASGARINFKVGPEKKSYALADADVALWQESENSWGARIKAQPVRTDFNLTDTGQLRVEASWRRAPSLHQTPMVLNLAWEYGQLGQVTQLLTGHDRGWRGGVDFSANLSGTPERLAIQMRAAIDGFRRYDIVDNRNVRLTTSCAASYDAIRQALSKIDCQSPVRDGLLRLRGDVALTAANGWAASSGWGKDWAYDVTFTVEQAPLASLAELLHEAKRQLPPDLAADGRLNAEFHAVCNGQGPPQFTGGGRAAHVHVYSPAAQDTLALGEIPLTLIGDSQCCKSGGRPLAKGKRVRRRASQGASEDTLSMEAAPLDPHLQIGPASLQVNASTPLTTGGWISASGFRFFLRGDLELNNLFRIEDALGVPGTRLAADGNAKVDVSISAAWKGLAAPNALGTAQLSNVRAEMRGLNIPVKISSATVILAPDVFSMQKLVAQTGSTHWAGSVAAPRHCAPACLFQFDLSADELSGDDLAQWLTPHPATRHWYRILSSQDQQGASPVVALRAHGSLHVARLELKKMAVTQVSTQVTIERSEVTLTGLHGNMLQGTHQGAWTIDASKSPLRYHGSGTLRNVSLAQMAALMNGPWISGTGDGSFDLQTSGKNLRELIGNSDGKLDFLVRNGSFAYVQLPGTSVPLPIHRFTGSLSIKKGMWELSRGRLESHDGFYQLNGTVGLGRGLDFVLKRGDEQSWKLTGTLAKPHVAPASLEISRKASSNSKP